MKQVDVPRMLDALGIQYREHGDELWAPCPHPSHKETRPSWSIADNPMGAGHGLHYCFGCQFTGNAIDLVMACLGDVSFSHACQWITDKGLWLNGAVPLDVSVEVTNAAARSKLKVPGGLRGGPLEDWVTPARRYAEERGLTNEQVMRWRIMYATDGAMAGRILFPLRDENGIWRSWHARTYSKQDKRYKNASNDDGYDPGAVFGMEHWPVRKARKNCSLVLTEGTLDALACERVITVDNCFICAIGGSEPHARQLLKLAGWASIICATDGDDAGDALAETLRQKLGAQSEVLRAPMPDGADAAGMDEDELLGVLSAADA